ncbi:MAG: hypothetical protein JXA11_03915 [Phycisphaerae bacterium]|nr:hypothetical protein [Phycisphaerae bacterium]
MERRNRTIGILWLWWLLVAICAVVFGISIPCRSDNPQGESSSVIYQVTYSDKSIRNLPDPPTTNQGILMVTRITRTNSSLPSTETVSTGNQSMEMLNPGRTQETQLTWDGLAWTSAVKISSPPLPAPPPAAAARQRVPSLKKPGAAQRDLPPSRGPQRNMTSGEVCDEIQKIMELLSVSERALREAEQKLVSGVDVPQDADAATRALEEAREAQQKAMTTVIQLKSSLRQSPMQTAGTTNTLRTTAPRKSYDPNRPILPPPTLDTNINVNGIYGGGWPGGGWGWPGFGGNVMIQSQQPNPDFDVGPRVIIREQK